MNKIISGIILIGLMVGLYLLFVNFETETIIGGAILLIIVLGYLLIRANET